MLSTLDVRERDRLKKVRQRQARIDRITPQARQILDGTRWLESPRFLAALGVLPENAQIDAAYRVLRVAPQTVETAESIIKPPQIQRGDIAAAADWIITQAQARAYRGKIASPRRISVEEAKDAARKVAVDELPDLLDAALAVVQSPNGSYAKVGGLRAGILRMARVSKARRRQVARNWREHGEAIPARHGQKQALIRVSFEQALQDHDENGTYIPFESLSAGLDGKSVMTNNPYGIPWYRERRTGYSYDDVYGLPTKIPA